MTRFFFFLPRIDSTQCLVGNCFEAANPGIDGFSDTISVVLNRAGSSNGSDADVSDITISIAYQDKYLMSDPDSMEITTLNVEGPFEVSLIVFFPLFIFFRCPSVRSFVCLFFRSSLRLFPPMGVSLGKTLQSPSLLTGETLGRH